MKKIVALVVISAFIISAFIFSNVSMASQNKPLERLGKGLDNIVYGHVEVPDNINQTNSKGKAIDSCTAKTKDDVGRGIARVVKGIFEIATFWYPQD